MRCRWARRCWPSSRSARPSICWTSRSSTRNRGCSSAGRSDRSRRSSTASRTCWSTSNTRRSTAYHAIWALADGSDDPALATSIAQAVCSAALSHVATDTIQVHGGIGFTWEHQAHLYYKRAATDAALLGSAEQHRSRVAAMVLDGPPSSGCRGWPTARRCGVTVPARRVAVAARRKLLVIANCGRAPRSLEVGREWIGADLLLGNLPDTLATSMSTSLDLVGWDARIYSAGR